MPSSGYVSAAIGFVALGSVGCSAPVADDVADASLGSTAALVVIERTTAPDGAQANVSAKFMRLAGAADADILARTVGSPLEVPARGSCKALGAGRDKHGPGAIELLDVGDVTVRAEQMSMPLAARAFPEVDRVSGVFYTSRDASIDLPAGARYVIEGSGAALDHFSIEAEAPNALDDVRIADAVLGEGVALEDGASANVRWRSGAERDLVLVDVAAATGATTRCAFDDVAGEGRLPASVLRADTLGGSATIAVHRVRRVAITGAVDAGELRFDLVVVGRASFVGRGSVRGAAPSSP